MVTPLQPWPSDKLFRIHRLHPLAQVINVLIDSLRLFEKTSLRLSEA